MNQKVDRFVTRINNLSDQLIENLANAPKVQVAPICMPVAESQIGADYDEEEEEGDNDQDKFIDPDWRNKLPNFVAENQYTEIIRENGSNYKNSKKRCSYCRNDYLPTNFARHQGICPKKESYNLDKQLEWLYSKYERLLAEHKIMKSEHTKFKCMSEMFLKGEVIAK